MGEKIKKVDEEMEKNVEKYEYKNVSPSGYEVEDQKRLNSLGKESESIDRIQKEREKEQKEILELREVIKKAAEDNAEELTSKIQQMFTKAKDLMEKNNQELTEKSIENLKDDLSKLMLELGSPIVEIKEYLVQEGRDEEFEKIQNAFLENLEDLAGVIKAQSERIDKLETKTKDIIKNIVEKVVGVEISNQSDVIIQSNITLLYEEFREAQRVEILLSQEDYAMVEDRLIAFLESKGFTDGKLVIKKDKNIKRGSFLILTDKGNFDNNIEDRVKLVIDSIL